MFQFLQPISLFASAGILIPIIIHLWNVRQGKVLKVGSIALLQESDRQQARSIKLKDLLLLLLRCLLIILLAMLLAKPQYQKQLTIQDEKGWIVVARNELPTAYKNYQPLIDSLAKAGYQFHYFEEGFAKEELTKALVAADTSTAQATTYWQTLSLLNKEVPAELPVYLFTSNELRRFAGNQPSLSMNLAWKTFSVNDTTASFLSDAYQSASGLARVGLATSTPSATVNTVSEISLQQPPQSFSLQTDYRTLSYTDSLGNKSQAELDTATLNVVVYADKYIEDANYLKAGINAIRDFGKYKINLLTARKVADIPAQHDWLFWLSEQPLPAQHTNNNVFVYATGKEQSLHSWIVINDGKGSNDGRIELMKRVQANDSPGDKKLWTDGFGNPLLILKTSAKWSTSRDSIAPPFGGQGGSFYSRFNPAWNELVWSKAFPAMLHDLLFDENENTIHPLDKRVIDKNQVQPVMVSTKNGDKEKFVEMIDLSKLCWLLAFAVFFVERFVSLKIRKEVKNG